MYWDHNNLIRNISCLNVKYILIRSVTVYKFKFKLKTEKKTKVLFDTHVINKLCSLLTLNLNKEVFVLLHVMSTRIPK